MIIPIEGRGRDGRSSPGRLPTVHIRAVSNNGPYPPEASRHRIHHPQGIIPARVHPVLAGGVRQGNVSRMRTDTTGATIVANLVTPMASGRARFRRGWGALIAGTDRWHLTPGRVALLLVLLMIGPSVARGQLPGLTKARQSLDSAAKAAAKADAAAATPSASADTAQTGTIIDPIEMVSAACKLYTIIDAKLVR